MQITGGKKMAITKSEVVEEAYKNPHFTNEWVYEGLTAKQWERLASQKESGDAPKISISDVPNEATATECRLAAETLRSLK
jgi:hypothetical protein